MKTTIVSVIALLAGSVGNAALVPSYPIDCQEVSMSVGYKIVVREKLASGQDVLQLREMLGERVQNQTSYSPSTGGMDKYGNRMLQADEISMNMGHRHKRITLRLSAESGFRQGTLIIESIIGGRTLMDSRHAILCK